MTDHPASNCPCPACDVERSRLAAYDLPDYDLPSNDALLDLQSERDKKIDALIEIFEEDIRHHRFGRKTRTIFHTGGN